nr:haloacid dehalogenase-like hydrolase domain-containing protein At4g39970 isoform X1 [Coffea arabica]
MASSSSSFTMLLSAPNPSLSPSSSRTTLSTLSTTFLPTLSSSPSPSPFSPTAINRRRGKSLLVSAAAAGALQALIFDCDGVILESEHLHRQAYNDAFSHFNVRCSSSATEPLNWGLEFYDELQNRIGGGKPKMRWYFGEYGWPTSRIFETPPDNKEDREKLVDIIQDWKTERYKEIIKSGTVKPRPGVLRLMDETKASGKKLAICSAATKSSVILCLENLIGIERFQGLDCFLAGDDVKEKKPNPSIYLTAAKKLGVSGGDCLVVEDSVIGLQAATGAGMPCIITYTCSTANQDFKEAIAKFPDLSDVRMCTGCTADSQIHKFALCVI